MNDTRTVQERLEGAAADDGRVSVAEAIEIVNGAQPAGPSIDDQIRQAEKDGDMVLSIQLKRRLFRHRLDVARANANGGAR